MNLIHHPNNVLLIFYNRLKILASAMLRYCKTRDAAASLLSHSKSNFYRLCSSNLNLKMIKFKINLVLVLFHLIATKTNLFATKTNTSSILIFVVKP